MTGMSSNWQWLTGHRPGVGAHRLHVGAGGLTPSDRRDVLVLGLVMSARYVEPLAVELVRDHLMVAPDLPESGDSPQTAVQLSLTELTLHQLMRPEVVHRLVLTTPVLGTGLRALPRRARPRLRGSSVRDLEKWQR